MEMLRLSYFDFYGVSVRLQVEVDPSVADRALITQLEEDFWYFRRPQLKMAQFDIDIEIVNHFIPKKLPRIYSDKMVEVRGWARSRQCDYGGVVLESFESLETRQVKLFGSNQIDLAYEVLYNFILSAVGEKLDQAGFHRVHALGIEYRDTAGLILLNSGQGKSSLALQLIQKNNARIYSDEMPLIKAGMIYPFPIRIALKRDVCSRLAPNLAKNSRKMVRKLYGEKILIPISREQIAEPKSVNFILVPSHINSRWSAIKYLGSSMVVGYGLAQMKEHMLRVHLIRSFGKISVSRARESMNLSRKARIISFVPVRDAFENFKKLIGILGEIK